jgi:hypothetical protein
VRLVDRDQKNTPRNQPVDLSLYLREQNMITPTVARTTKVLFVFAWIIFLFYHYPIMGYITEASFLSREFLNITEIAADLSLLVYFEKPENRAGFDHWKVYQDENDRAVLAEKLGYCFVAFRGTDLTNWGDIQQNLIPGRSAVCPRDTCSMEGCCETRKGFWSAYDTSYRTKLEKDIIDCTITSAADNFPSHDDNPNHTDLPDTTKRRRRLVLVGHSHGGSVAQIAAVVWQSFRPTVISFGNEPTWDPACANHLDSSQWVRYANTRIGHWYEIPKLQYDIYPFQLPVLDRGLVNLGYTYLLSDDATGVANIGYNNPSKILPYDILSLFRSHRILAHEDDSTPGYRNRIKQLVAKNPVRTTGFVTGSLCSQDIECVSDRCVGTWWDTILGRKHCL